jgi:asparagine synthase (glutamine-hydrolysing)
LCGIAGIVSLDKPLDVELIKKMTYCLRHRGPDDEGYLGINMPSKAIYNLYSSESQVKKGFELSSFSEHLNMFMGHRRLSIIDLSPAGHQPMSYDNELCWIVFNGEIFNYKELKEELKAKGHEFITHTDTEVILASYKQWGKDCVKYFNGDWAFALYDKNKNSIFLSRDRFSIKPLYYSYNPDSKLFTFASEIKALFCVPDVSKAINEEKCFEFLTFFLHEHSNQTLYRDVYQIEPGSSLVLNLDTFKLDRHKYYDLQYEPSLGSYEDKKALAYADDIRELLIDSVRLRLRADVPIGTCLSGGLDSSSLVVIINKLLKEGGVSPDQIGKNQKTFTCSFPKEPIDETAFAKLIIEHTNSEAYFTYPTIDGANQEITRLITHQEEPFGSASIYAQWKVFEKASTHVKVVLDGQGADEIFGGYAKYRSAYIAQLIRTFSPVKALGEFIGTVKMHNSFKKTLTSLVAMPLHLVPDALKKRLYVHRKRALIDKTLEQLQTTIKAIPFEYLSSFRPNLNNMLYSYQMKYSLPHLLHYEDRNSMAFSIESRTPFTDYRLVDYLFSIPACYKFHDGWSKWLLRLAMKDLLPSKILWRKDKIGFDVSAAMEKYDRAKIFDIWVKQNG